jgi:hypothetical protein
MDVVIAAALGLGEGSVVAALGKLAWVVTESGLSELSGFLGAVKGGC